MSKHHIKYVKKRKDVYQYVRRVPSSVIANPQAFAKFFGNKKTFRISLKTKDKTEAFASASMVNQQFEQNVAASLCVQIPIVAARSAKRIPNTNDLGQITKKIREDMIKEFGPTIIRAKMNDDAQDYLDWRFDNKADENAELHRLSQSGSLKATKAEQTLADEIVINSNFDAPKDSTSYAAILGAIREGNQEGENAVTEMVEGKLMPSLSSSVIINQVANTRNINGQPQLFSEVAEFQNHQKSFTPKTLAKRKRAHDEFISIVGDKPIEQIDFDDVALFLEEVSKHKVGNLNRPISKETLQSYKSAVSSVLRFAISRRWRSGPNPTSDIDLTAYTYTNTTETIVKCRRFEESELIKLFSLPRFQGCKCATKIDVSGDHLLNNSKFWVPVVALYTGARTAELGALRLDEIKMEPVPHIVINDNEYGKIKGDQSKDNSREIPILDVLFDLGFREYLDELAARGETRVFPDWQPYEGNDEDTRWSNSAFIKEFHRNIRNKLFPKQAGESRSRVRFYSFRGALKRLLFEKDNKQFADAVLGHDLDDLDDRYVGKIEIEKLHEYYHHLKYENVIIPARTKKKP